MNDNGKEPVVPVPAGVLAALEAVCTFAHCKTTRSRSAEKSTRTRDLKTSRGTLPKNGSGQGTYLPKHHTKSEILTCICCC